jgi:hypothetical protein
MSIENDIEELSRKEEKLLACISTSETFEDFKDCIETPMSHFDIHEAIQNAAKQKKRKKY